MKKRKRQKIVTVKTEKCGRCTAYLCGGINGSAILQQQLHHLDAVLLACNVQWGEAVLKHNHTVQECAHHLSGGD